MHKPQLEWNKIGFVLAYSLSFILLITVFISNRSLFLDGLNLARNVAESSFAQLSGTLKYQQSAPLLFLYISKVATSALGVSEYSLRLFPLLSGIACLYFFGSTLNKLLQSKYVIIGIIWLGTHSMFLRYATEFKQYIADAFVCIFLIWLVLKIDKLDTKNSLIIGLIGTIAIWLSMPSIFVLIGLLAYYFHLHFESNKSFKPIFILTAWFLLNFAFEYFLVLSPAIDSNHMQNFHQNYFLQGKFWKLESLGHDLGLVESLIRMAVGKSGIAITAALVLIIVCVYDFIKRKSGKGILLLLPIVAVFGASLLGKYSLIERLMLFSLPILFILMLWGLQIVVKKLKTKNAFLRYSSLAILGLAFFIGFIQTQGIKYLFQPLKIEDNRSALIHINQHEKHDNSIVCTQLAYPAYAYYTKYDKNYNNMNLGKAKVAQYDESVINLVTNQSEKDDKDVWVLMGHMQEHEISDLISELEKVGVIKNSYRSNKRSAAILFSTQ